ICDDQTVRTLAHVLDQSVGKNQDAKPSIESLQTPDCVSVGFTPEFDGSRKCRREYQDEDSSRVGSTLALDRSAEYESDHNVYGDQEDYEGASIRHPIRRHTKTWEIAWDQVEEARHRGGARKPE